MTLESLALRIKEVRDLQKLYLQTPDLSILDQLIDREADLDKLVNSIVNDTGQCK